MNPARKLYYIVRYLGPGFLTQRARMAVEKKLGHARKRFAPRPWESIKLEEICAAGTPKSPDGYAAFKARQNIPFLFPLGAPPTIPAFAQPDQATRIPPLGERIALARQDRAVYFFRTAAEAPVDWYRNGLSGARGISDRTWCDIPDFSPAQGDVRALWEPARAAWALDLARAAARGACPEAAEVFWRWTRSWMNACPPYLGVQWKCGQEASVRFAALAIAYHALARDAGPLDWRDMARIAWATGYRVFHHIDYAVSQNNNHAVSEAVGLLLIAHLYPEFRDAKRWGARGRAVLAESLRRQIFDDGSYIQHSFNYQRVMMQMAALGLRIGELSGAPLERDAYERLARSAEFCYLLMEPANGRLPNYGHNDGALPLPLTECEFQDYRPAIQTCVFLARREAVLPPGPWDEERLWLFGDANAGTAAHKLAPAASSALRTGGYYTLRSRESWAFVRCHAYRTRPAQADALHVDLWWRGVNVACDCGTYLYYDPQRPDREHHFKSVTGHNAIEIDGCDPVTNVSRFLWLPFPQAWLRRFEPGPGGGVFEGESRDYDRAPVHVLHRRTLATLDDGVWVVVDDLLGAGAHDAVLRWHLCEGEVAIDAAALTLRHASAAGEMHVALALSGGDGVTQALAVRCGDDTVGDVQGWASPYYAQRSAIPVAELRVRGGFPLRLVTVFSPERAARLSLQPAEAGEMDLQIVRAGQPQRARLGALRRGLERVWGGAVGS